MAKNSKLEPKIPSKAILEALRFNFGAQDGDFGGQEGDFGAQNGGTLFSMRIFRRGRWNGGGL